MTRGTYPACAIMNTAITDKGDDGDGVTWLQPTCGTAHFHCLAIARLRREKTSPLTSVREPKHFPEKKSQQPYPWCPARS